MTTAADLEIIVLAAGLSRRMGARNKLLLPIADEPLIRRSVRTYLACSLRVTVVLGHEADAIRDALEGLDVRFVTNENYAEGQKTSVAIGLANAALDGKAVMIGLADQPLLEPADLHELMSAFTANESAKIVVPYFGDARGNPVLFPTSIAQNLRADGANPACRAFIDSHPEITHRHMATNNHFTTDMDTPADFADLCKPAENSRNTNSKETRDR